MGATFLSRFQTYAAVPRTFFNCFGLRRFFAFELARSVWCRLTETPTQWVAHRKTLGKGLVRRPLLSVSCAALVYPPFPASKTDTRFKRLRPKRVAIKPPQSWGARNRRKGNTRS